jgi:signal transduction histidine kinase/CheY-like chemotaxis protein
MAFRITAPLAWQPTELQPDGPPEPVSKTGLSLGLAAPQWRALAVLGLVAALALVLALVHWALSGRARALAWLLGVVCVLAGLAVQIWRLQPTDPSVPSGEQLGFTQHPGWTNLLAAAWGLAPWWLGLDTPLVARVMMILALASMAVVGAHVLASERRAVCQWLVLLLGPLIVVALTHGSPEFLQIAAFGCAALAATLFFALDRHRLLNDAAQTKLNNDALVRELRQQVFLVERANRDKSRFLAAASHDLRQPMHALGLFAASLEKSLVDSPLQPTVVNMMRAVDALEQSCSAMLDLSKLDAGVVEPNMQSFPIRDVFRRLHMHCAGQAEELGLGLRFKPGGRIVTSDPQLLERVLANLVHNSIRYTKEGGIVVLARNRADRISLEVWDTGIGIPEDELPKVFDEFYQVSNSGRDRTRGLGMGLAIVKRLVMLMGHELEVKSRPGKGTVFRILLAPTELADMDNMVLGAETVPVLIDVNRTALVIDDEESIRIGMRDLLQSWGYEVLLAASIAQACTEVRRHASVIDIVLSDLRLANKEDGIDAIERVRAVYGAPLPALLITGDTSADEVKRAHDSGHQVLFKPVRPRELYSLLRNVP